MGTDPEQDLLRLWRERRHLNQAGWAQLYLQLHPCAEAPEPLSSLARRFTIASHHYKARELGIRRKKGEFEAGYEKTRIGRWLISIRLQPVAENIGCIRLALDHNPVARAAREALADSNSATDWESSDTPEPIMPEALRELIQRRTAVHTARFSPKPKTGQTLAVEEVIGPDGPLDRDLPQTLAVLLHKPTETSAVWSGWLVAGETDYAGYWDILLEPEDEPFDPRYIVQIEMMLPATYT